MRAPRRCRRRHRTARSPPARRDLPPDPRQCRCRTPSLLVSPRSRPNRSIRWARCAGPRSHRPNGSPPRRWMLSACRRSSSPARPLVVAGHDETHCRRFGQPLERHQIVTAAARCAAGLAQDTSMILAQAPSAPSVLTPAQRQRDRHRSMAHESSIRALRSDVIIGSDPPLVRTVPGCSPRRMANAIAELVTARLVAAAQDRRSVHASRSTLSTPRALEPATVHRLVDGLQAVGQRQVAAQVGPGDLAVGLPAATSQAATLPVARLAEPARRPPPRTRLAAASPSDRPCVAAETPG